MTASEVRYGFSEPFEGIDGECRGELPRVHDDRWGSLYPDRFHSGGGGAEHIEGVR